MYPSISSSTSFGTSSSHFRLTYPSPITFSPSVSPLCSSITPSLIHCRLKTYMFHKSYPIISLLPPGLPRLFLLSNSFFVFNFYLFFVSVSFARLSQFLSARKYTVSYRIVSYHMDYKDFTRVRTDHFNIKNSTTTKCSSRHNVHPYSKKEHFSFRDRKYWLMSLVSELDFDLDIWRSRWTSTRRSRSKVIQFKRVTLLLS